MRLAVAVNPAEITILSVAVGGCANGIQAKAGLAIGVDAAPVAVVPKWVVGRADTRQTVVRETVSVRDAQIAILALPCEPMALAVEAQVRTAIRVEHT
jgi:hypothetical protein